ncbi:MAG TPA: hypothetical protein VHB21_23050, partial [Minicystis sp.]|nr:hypothetical protein [Minicystis sp.]
GALACDGGTVPHDVGSTGTGGQGPSGPGPVGPGPGSGAGSSTGPGAGGGGAGGGAPDCFMHPTTYLEIINACTDAEKIDKHPVLPLLEPDGGLPPYH